MQGAVHWKHSRYDLWLCRRRILSITLRRRSEMVRTESWFGRVTIRTESYSGRVIKILCQLVGDFSVDRASMKLEKKCIILIKMRFRLACES